MKRVCLNCGAINNDNNDKYCWFCWGRNIEYKYEDVSFKSKEEYISPCQKKNCQGWPGCGPCE